ncbi:hypothetical protein TWF281_009867 [Arthrobotrys megalospora]
MPLLEASPDGKSWLPSLFVPEQIPQGLDNGLPRPQPAYYLTPMIQPVVNANADMSQPMATTGVSPASGGRHEPIPTASSLSYTSPIALDSSLPPSGSRTDPDFINIQQPGILNHPPTIPIPGVHTPAWSMTLQEVLTLSNPSSMIEGSGRPVQLIPGFGTYAGPGAFHTTRSSNGFPVTVAGSEVREIHNSQSMQSSATPRYFTASGSRNANYSGPIHSNPAPASSPSANADYPGVFILQPSLKHNSSLQELIGFKSSQGIDDAEGPDALSNQNHVSLASNLAIDHDHAHANSWRTSAEDGLSDLNNMTQSWLKSHITSFEDALNHIPLEELGKQAIIVHEPGLLPQGKGCSWNLVKIENIPYNLDDDMLFEFLGKAPGLIPEEYGGIHIIMDRTTGKTMDCFLEFPTVTGAERFIQRRCNNNRRCILGGRHISLELVRQGELMRWLFPKVRGAMWGDDGDLVVGEWTGLNTLTEIISREELVMILGHARTPHRSPFSRKCLQRPYESLMSVVTKFPWKETDVYTLKQRDLIFQAAFEAGELLKRQILRGKAGPNIDLKLLRRLCRTISFCPGFTYRQKLTFLDAMGITTTECFAILGDLGISHPLATQFQALTVRPGADYVAVEAIASLVAGGLSRGNSIRNESDLDTRPGGTEASNEDCNYELTMRAAATIELESVLAAIKTTFTPGGDTMHY